MSKHIGIIGNGFVGKATNLFQCDNIKVSIYDVDESKCVPKGITLKEMVRECETVFICVPTPMKESGECHTKIVEDCIKNVRDCISSSKSCPFIVVRSTVPPGFCERNDVFHMPEFLTEKNWEQDFVNNRFWVVGANKNDPDRLVAFIDYVSELFNLAKAAGKVKSNDVVVMESGYSELLKYTRNTYLAVKLSFCNEIYEYCNKLGLEYQTLCDLLPIDRRITRDHTQVPGHDGKKGYGGTCLPKDIASLAFEMRKEGMEPYMLEASIKRNTTVDRPEKDWNSNVGRAILSATLEPTKTKENAIEENQI